MNLNLQKLDFNYRDLIIFILPVLIFSLYIFIYNPGILTLDSFSILHQLATGHFSNAYPFFYTFIIKICFKIFRSPITVAILQVLAFAVIWMIICKYHRDDAAESSNHFVVQFALTFIICLIPINAIYSITVLNYVLFSYALLFLCFLIKVMVDRNGQIGMKFSIALAVTLACVSGLSTFGVYIALLSLIAIIAYLYMKGQSESTFIKLTAMTVVLILLITSLSFVFHVENNGKMLDQSNIYDSSINVLDTKNQYFNSINELPKADFERVDVANLGNSKYDLINSFVDATHDNAILNLLFNNPVLYIVLAIAMLAFIFYTTRSYEIFLLYIPALLNAAIVFITGPAQFNLSLYVSLLVCYMIAIILISKRFDVDLEVQPAPAPQIIEETATQSNYGDYEFDIDAITFEEIEELIQESEYVPETETRTSTNEISQTEDEPANDAESASDLVDSILKEIEMEKENK